MVGSQLQTFIILGVFGGVILLIALDVMDIAVTALLGVCILLLTGSLTGEDVLKAMSGGGDSLALLFGGMVVARVLTPTGIFDIAGHYFVRAVNGSGKRYLIGLMILIAPICAFLPNATTVILTAPIIIRMAQALKVDFVTPVILCALVGNTAGILTLVGDPATFLVGSSIGLSFAGYLTHASLGGLISLLAVIPTLPFVARETWSTSRPPPEKSKRPKLEDPLRFGLSLSVLVLMIALFLVGPYLPDDVLPPSAAILCASLALLLVNSTKAEPVEKVLGEIDWVTLVFLASIFCLVEATSKTGVLAGFSHALYCTFGSNLHLAAIAILLVVFMISSVVANIPLILAMTLVLKGYFVVSGLMPEAALGGAYGTWPVWTLPVFIAMTFGTTLGGGATMVGDSSNIVACGICAKAGERVTFGRFLSVGLPVSLTQLAAAAIYVVVIGHML